MRASLSYPSQSRVVCHTACLSHHSCLTLDPYLGSFCLVQVFDLGNDKVSGYTCGKYIVSPCDPDGGYRATSPLSRLTFTSQSWPVVTSSPRPLLPQAETPVAGRSCTAANWFSLGSSCKCKQGYRDRSPYCDWGPIPSNYDGEHHPTRTMICRMIHAFIHSVYETVRVRYMILSDDACCRWMTLSDDVCCCMRWSDEYYCCMRWSDECCCCSRGQVAWAQCGAGGSSLRSIQCGEQCR